MSSIIDCHTHRYSTELISDPHLWSARKGNEKHWVALIDSPLQGWSDRRRMLADMDAAGVERAVLLGWYWQQHESCKEQNKWHAKWIKEDPDRFIAFVALQPAFGLPAIDELKRCHDLGFKGIGELHFSAQEFRFTDSVWESIAEYAQENGLVLNLHVTEPVGGTHAARIPTEFAAFQSLVEAFPDLSVILAHWGGLLPYYELNPAVKASFKNVYYDMAAGPLLYDKRIYRSIVDIAGPEKVLFGSDYPLKLYPKTQEEHDFKTYLTEVMTAGLTGPELEMILGGNARRLFGL